jgi:hypothetical protein
MKSDKMAKAILDGNAPVCSCKVELEDSATARILYCPIHAHSMEMFEVMRLVDTEQLASNLARTAIENVLSKMRKATT